MIKISKNALNKTLALSNDRLWYCNTVFKASKTNESIMHHLIIFRFINLTYAYVEFITALSKGCFRIFLTHLISHSGSRLKALNK